MNIKFSFNTDPWRSFVNIISLHMALLTFNFGLFLFILIVIGDFFIERFFCRYLCPLGAIFVFTSKLKFLRIKKPKDKCGKCTACTKTCSMNLNLYKVNIVKDADCINCFKCIEVCPKKNAKLSIGQKTLNTLAIISVSIISFFILYAIKKPTTKFLNKKIVNVEISNAFTKSLTDETSNNKPNTNTNVSANKSSSTTNPTYTNGTYTGQAFGYNGEIEVAVTINSNNINNIKITKINDTPSYAQQPSILIPQEIISSQSTNINAISGATSTSFGIINAVKNALGKAKN
ncbi:MAG: FMN-binding protein [Sarcina sp.]